MSETQTSGLPSVEDVARAMYDSVEPERDQPWAEQGDSMQFLYLTQAAAATALFEEARLAVRGRILHHDHVWHGAPIDEQSVDAAARAARAAWFRGLKGFGGGEVPDASDPGTRWRDVVHAVRAHTA